MENNFNDYVNAQEHNEEIRASRVGGLGGSDADLVWRVGRNGLSALTNTDKKRLAVMLGQAEADNWGGNAYTNAGHTFEDYVAKILVAGLHRREFRLEANLARNFKTFAHADFFGAESGVVHECKFVGETDTQAVINKYYAQLQWYYLLGAYRVKIVHGTGEVEPFKVQDVNVEFVERDEQVIDALKNGIALLDEYVSNFVYADTQADVSSLDDEVQNAIHQAILAKNEADRWAKKYEEEKAKVEKYMTDNKLSKIETATNTITLSAPTTSRTFDTKSFLRAHAEFDVEEWYKTSARKGTFTIKPIK